MLIMASAFRDAAGSRWLTCREWYPIVHVRKRAPIWSYNNHTWICHHPRHLTCLYVNALSSLFIMACLSTAFNRFTTYLNMHISALNWGPLMKEKHATNTMPSSCRRRRGVTHTIYNGAVDDALFNMHRYYSAKARKSERERVWMGNRK